MRYLTEHELREQFAGGTPSQYQLPEDCRLTPLARDYLSESGLLRENGAAQPSSTAKAPKPEHMTHLNGRELVSKQHPRIVLRGKLDTLESEILLMMTQYDEPWRGKLRDALMLVRQILAVDVKETALPPWTLDGMDAEKVHRCSHHPEEFGFQGHILPAPEQGLLAAQFNRLRALSREVELVAVSAYRQGDHLDHPDSILALNRLSSYFYVLQLQAARGRA